MKNIVVSGNIAVVGALLCAATALVEIPGNARAQNLYEINDFGGTIGQYNATTGSTINASLVSGLGAPQGLAYSGGDLFVANASTDKIGVYDATTGAAVNGSLISGLDHPSFLTISGNNLYVSYLDPSGHGAIGEWTTSGATVNATLVDHPGLVSAGLAVVGQTLYVVANSAGNNNSIQTYDATTGSLINGSLITGLTNAHGIAISGNNLYVTEDPGGAGQGFIGEYNATTGATINASLVTGLNNPDGDPAVFGGNLYVSNIGSGNIGVYNATTGATVNASFISGLNGPLDMLIPEPATWLLLVVGSSLVALRRCMRRPNC